MIMFFKKLSNCPLISYDRIPVQSPGNTAAPSAITQDCRVPSIPWNWLTLPRAREPLSRFFSTDSAIYRLRAEDDIYITVELRKRKKQKKDTVEEANSDDKRVLNEKLRSNYVTLEISGNN